MHHLRASAPPREPILLLRTPPPEKPRQQRRGLALADPRIDLGPMMTRRLTEEPRPMLDRATLRIHRPELYSGIGESEAAALLRGFFRDRRG